MKCIALYKTCNGMHKLIKMINASICMLQNAMKSARGSTQRQRSRYREDRTCMPCKYIMSCKGPHSDAHSSKAVEQYVARLQVIVYDPPVLLVEVSQPLEDLGHDDSSLLLWQRLQEAKVKALLL